LLRYIILRRCRSIRLPGKGYPYKSIDDVVKGTDCLVILVEHSIFKEELKKNEEIIKNV